MSSNQIPGVPEGWEVEHVSRIGEAGEHCVGPYGEPHLLEGRTACRVCIIRKIETPAKYRPFESAEEFKPHRDRWIRRKDNGHEMRTTSFCDSVHFTGNDGETWETMLADYIFDDGTPFGVRIDE
jgi:hypothetical protein